MSAIVEPIAVVLGAYAVMSMPQLLPYALSFAAGAMIYVVVEKLVPGAQEHKNTIATGGKNSQRYSPTSTDTLVRYL